MGMDTIERYSVMRWTFLLLVWGVLNPAFAQETESGQEVALDSIRTIASLMLDGETGGDRMAAGMHLKKLLLKELALKGSFDLALQEVPQLSVVTDPGRTFRIITWQIYLGQGRFQQYGILQYKDHDRPPVVLTNRRDAHPRPEKLELGAEAWQGQVYYNIHPFRHKSRKYWVLFGYASLDETLSRKSAEILHFDDAGSPVLGAPFFVYRDEHGAVTDRCNRVLLDFHVSAQVKLNYDSLHGMILFDHLIPWSQPGKKETLTWVPDGSYCGFQWKKGEWRYIDKVFHHVMDEAPVEFPVLKDRQDRDIFGRPRGKPGKTPNEPSDGAQHH